MKKENLRKLFSFSNGCGKAGLVATIIGGILIGSSILSGSIYDIITWKNKK